MKMTEKYRKNSGVLHNAGEAPLGSSERGAGFAGSGSSLVTTGAREGVVSLASRVSRENINLASDMAPSYVRLKALPKLVKVKEGEGTTQV